MSYVRQHIAVEDDRAGPLHSAAAPILVVQAASAVSTRLRDHRNAYNVIDITDEEIVVAIREWGGSEWITRR